MAWPPNNALVVEVVVSVLPTATDARTRAALRLIEQDLQRDVRALLNATRSRVRAAAPRRTGRLARSFRVYNDRGPQGRRVVLTNAARGAGTRFPTFYGIITNRYGRTAGWWDSATEGVRDAAEDLVAGASRRTAGALAGREIRGLQTSLARIGARRAARRGASLADVFVTSFARGVLSAAFRFTF